MLGRPKILCIDALSPLQIDKQLKIKPARQCGVRLVG